MKRGFVVVFVSLVAFSYICFFSEKVIVRETVRFKSLTRKIGIAKIFWTLWNELLKALKARTASLT